MKNINKNNTIKTAIFVVFFNLDLFGGASELFKKAQQLESAGDTAGAMKFYKEAAKAAMERNDAALTQNLENEISQGAPIQENYPAKPQTNNDKSKENLEKVASDPLGIKLYHFNYLLPATYAKNVPNDGRKRFETKFQFSVQKPLFYDVWGLKESIGIAYSQTSWWQTDKISAPFRETNYRPEIFIDFDTKDSLKAAHISNVRGGILHESNGRDGENSRSWNRLYLQAKFDFANLSLTPRIWTVIGDKSDNKNIENYAGRADINIAFTYKEQIFNLMVRNNLQFDKTNRGAAEFSWLFPILSSGLYGYLQYFNGYDESLIDYNRHTNKIGIGFTLLK